MSTQLTAKQVMSFHLMSIVDDKCTRAETYSYTTFRMM
jgi:hypothetical protein